MSQNEQADQDNKSLDKKEIADEEREKMLNVENSKHTGEAPNPQLEAEGQKPKRNFPIGVGLKMPGFCSRSKNKEAQKDDDTKQVMDGSGDAAAAKDAESAAEKSGTPSKGRGLLDAIRLPSLASVSSVFTRKTKKEPDAELGNQGLAGAETLEDNNQEKNADDGMETVRLDSDAIDSNPPKQHPFLIYLNNARRNPMAMVAVALVVLLTIVILGFASVGPKRPFVLPLIDGKYKETQTSCGMVRGQVEDGAIAFRGIQFAQKPIGELRWKHARPLNGLDYCWNGTYNASKSSNQCWQRHFNGSIDGSEDCLYLDVFTPGIEYNAELYPVVVLIAAETLEGSSPGVILPYGILSKQRKVIFVRPNFRLGVFGFLASEALEDGHPPTSGNYGLSDIVAALNWVQQNIQHFGGNKNRVTVWGHRAGGTLATALIDYNSNKTLFSQLWISSGSNHFPVIERKSSQQFNEKFLQGIKCKELSCLKKKTAEELMDAVPSEWRAKDLELPGVNELGSYNETASGIKHEWLVNDGTYIKSNVNNILLNNNASLPVKIMIGTTAQAGVPRKMLSENFAMTEEEIVKTVNESILGKFNLTDKVWKYYNKTVKGLATMISDIRVVCPLYAYAVSNKEIPFYVSVFPTNRDLTTPDSDAEAILELITVRDNRQERHVGKMRNLFYDFVYHGKIKDLDIEKRKKIIIVDQDIFVENDYKNCDFWLDRLDNPIQQIYSRVD